MTIPRVSDLVCRRSLLYLSVPRFTSEDIWFVFQSVTGQVIYIDEKKRLPSTITDYSLAVRSKPSKFSLHEILRLS